MDVAAAVTSCSRGADDGRAVAAVTRRGTFMVGDEVVSLLDHESPNGHIVKGERGFVTGPSSKPSHRDAADKVCCSFPNMKSVNLSVLSQVHKVGNELDLRPSSVVYSRTELAGGLEVGDEVVALVDYEDEEGGFVAPGDVGTVLGPSDKPEKKGSTKKVSCSFPTMPRVNLLADLHIAKVDSEIAKRLVPRSRPVSSRPGSAAGARRQIAAQ